MRPLYFCDRMKPAIISLLLALIMTAGAKAQEDDTPRLEFVMELSVSIGEPLNVGDTGKGHRTIIPITGGTFRGPAINGKVLPGGADYQLYDNARARNNLEAIYCIMTDDGEYIKVANRGFATEDYFFTSPVFEASYDGKYAWLNDGIYVCRPSGFADGVIKLKVWKVI